MCGLHGILVGTKREINADDFVSDGFVAGSLRGSDSSGIASIDTVKGASTYHKLPLQGSDFITNKYALKLVKLAPDIKRLTMCHTRAATSGGIDYDTAHPFFIQDNDGREIIGCHNGTLTGWAGKENAKYYSVDSEWALNHIFDKGIEAFKDFNGAYCFTWWDSAAKDTLNIALNGERPLHIVKLDDGGFAYASEPGMLYWLLERRRIKMIGDIIPLEANKLYKIKVGEDISEEDLPKPLTTSYTTTYNYSRGGYHAGNTATVVDKVEALVAKIMQATKEGTTNVVTFPEPNTSKVTVVTKEEIKLAAELGYQGERVEFIPSYYDEETHTISGTVLSRGAEFEGLMRNVTSRDFGPDTKWGCVVLGAFDSTNEIFLVVSKPRVELKDVAKAVADKIAANDSVTVH